MKDYVLYNASASEAQERAREAPRGEQPPETSDNNLAVNRLNALQNMISVCSYP